MPYVNYSDRMMALQVSPWYKLSEFTKALKTIQNISFSANEAKQQALEALAALNTDAPYSMTQRFDLGELYICESLGDWKLKLGHLRSVLNYRAKDKDAKAKNEGPGSKLSVEESKKHNEWNQDDAQQGFTKTCAAMWRQIANLDGVYSRKSFEALLRPGWVGKEIQKEEDEMKDLIHELNEEVFAQDRQSMRELIELVKTGRSKSIDELISIIKDGSRVLGKDKMTEISRQVEENASRKDRRNEVLGVNMTDAERDVYQSLNKREKKYFRAAVELQANLSLAASKMTGAESDEDQEEEEEPAAHRFRTTSPAPQGSGPSTST